MLLSDRGRLQSPPLVPPPVGPGAGAQRRSAPSAGGPRPDRTHATPWRCASGCSPRRRSRRPRAPSAPRPVVAAAARPAGTPARAGARPTSSAGCRPRGCAWPRCPAARPRRTTGSSPTAPRPAPTEIRDTNVAATRMLARTSGGAGRPARQRERRDRPAHRRRAAGLVVQRPPDARARRRPGARPRRDRPRRRWTGCRSPAPTSSPSRAARAR